MLNFHRSLATARSAISVASLLLLCGQAYAQPADDCNNNGIPDQIDLYQQSHDANNNGIPDECDIDITFDQISWPDGNGGYASFHSDWGRASIVFDPSTIQFLFPHESGGFHGWVNIMTYVQGGQGINWAVQNLPVYAANPNTFQGSLPTGVWFDLAVPPGTPVQQIHYSVVITEQPQNAPPQGGWKMGVPVGQSEELFGGEKSSPGIDPPFWGHTGQAEVAPAHNFIGAPPGAAQAGPASAIVLPEDQIEPVNERTNECWPGAISRSLKYLDAQHDTIALKEGGDTATAQEINDKLRTAGPNGYMGVEDTSLENGIAGKDKYVREKKASGEIGGKGIKTDPADPGDFAAVGLALKQGADVEIRINWGKNENEEKAVCHIAFVSDINPIKDARGNVIGFTVTTIDDVQGDGVAQNRKTVHTFEKGNDNGKTVWKLKGGKPGAVCQGFVVEKYAPPVTAGGKKKDPDSKQKK